jgi:hypothetical protein
MQAQEIFLPYSGRVVSKISWACMLLVSERVRGVARDSNARRRSHSVWAPPHNIFLVKNIAPAFDSSIAIQTKNGPSDDGPFFG